MKRTYVRLMDGLFYWWYMALLRPDAFAPLPGPGWILFVAYRKKPLNAFPDLPLSFIF